MSARLTATATISGTSPPPGTIAIGGIVEIVTQPNVNVRATPAGTLLGTQPYESTATVTAGPKTKSLNGESVIWWNLNFPSGPDGWVGADNLVPLSPPSTFLDSTVNIFGFASSTFSGNLGSVTFVSAIVNIEAANVPDLQRTAVYAQKP